MRQRKLFPIAVSVAEVADSLGVERREIYRAIKEHGLPVYRHGTKRRILVADVVAWIRATWKQE
jgi:excisionase family DNA binding protein